MIPIVLITGFLGSGKTTFLNWLLEQHPDLKISVILNEFGDTKLESQFVKYHQDNIVELANGCMCCVAKSDIPRMLSYILQHSPQTEYILIEASGLSDPDPVREALQTPPISDRAYLESTICIVDAVNFEQMRAENSIVTSQIADADLVVLSKVSQAGPEQVAQVTALLGRMVPDLRVLPFDKTLSPQIFLQGDLASQRPANQRPASKRSTSEHDHHSHDEYDVFWHTLDQPLDLDQVSAYLKNLPTNVIRIKGVIKCSSPTGQTFWVRLQRVGAHYTAEPIPEPPTEPKESTILLIGKKLDQPAIRACLTDFMALK